MLHKLATYALLMGAFTLLCVSCTDSDDAAAMAAGISGGSGGELVMAGLAPVSIEPNLPVNVELDFASAAPPETESGDSALSFTVKCDRGGNQTLTMTDPKHAENASVDLGFCKVDVTPVIHGAKVLGDDRCKANGGYNVNLFDEGGKMMGAFEVRETGTLALRCSSQVTCYRPRLNFSGENTDGERLDRYMIFPMSSKPGDLYQPLLAVEYRQAPAATEHQFDAPDGYAYTYAFHGGTLRVYPQEALAELADEVAADNRAASKGAGSAGSVVNCGSGAASSGGG